MSIGQLLQNFVFETVGDMVPCVHFVVDKIGDLVPSLAVKQGKREQRLYIAYLWSWRGRERQQQRRGGEQHRR